MSKGERTGSTGPEVGQTGEVGQDVHGMSAAGGDGSRDGQASAVQDVVPTAERRTSGRRADDRRAEEEQQARDEQRELYSTLDLALRIGEVLLSSGAGTADATATILGVTAAGGLRGCEVDITFTSIAISYQAAPDVAPETHMRVVRYRSQDFSRLTDVDRSSATSPAAT